ncbi:hypothetical protein DE146DRAFT_736616 [Phaeosphaeria sp. MPI-PUGE-AT-0046c]|nr:hypothetical protein DE146DRAFT_736616 [Phaeosphaeria sp. MPI-PUGE-AT-0046c]
MDLKRNAIHSHQDLSTIFVEPILEEFGSLIWAGSNSARATQTHSTEYPRHLEYSDNRDRESRAKRQWANDSSLYSDALYESDYTANDENLSTTSTSRPVVPVAQMLPDPALNHTVFQRKRRQSRHEGAADSAPGSRSRRKASLHCNTSASKEPDPEWLPTPPISEEIHDRNIPDRPPPGAVETHRSNQRTIAESIDAGYPRVWHLPEKDNPGPTGNVRATKPDMKNDDTQSAVGRTKTGPESSTTSSSSYQRASPNTPAKSDTSPRDLKALRSRLASKMVGVMSSGMENPDILLIEHLVKVVEELSNGSHLQHPLSRWLEYLHYVTCFYKATGFKGNLATTDKFLEIMPGGCPVDFENVFI